MQAHVTYLNAPYSQTNSINIIYINCCLCFNVRLHLSSLYTSKHATLLRTFIAMENQIWSDLFSFFSCRWTNPTTMTDFSQMNARTHFCQQLVPVFLTHRLNGCSTKQKQQTFLSWTSSFYFCMTLWFRYQSLKLEFPYKYSTHPINSVQWIISSNFDIQQ